MIDGLTILENFHVSLNRMMFVWMPIKEEYCTAVLLMNIFNDFHLGRSECSSFTSLLPCYRYIINQKYMMSSHRTKSD